MDALEELKKRQEAKELEQQAVLKQKQQDQENDLLKTKNEILAEIAKYKNLNVDEIAKDKKFNEDGHALGKMYAAIATEKDGIFIGEGKYFPSMTMLIRSGGFNEKSWVTIIEKGHLPDSYKQWFIFLSEDSNLANQLIEAVKEAKEWVDEKKRQEWEKEEKRKKITIAIICIPVTVIFFCLIFISRSASIVWGNVILFAIIAESWMISAESHDIGNKIAQIVCAPILGGIAGIIVGGIAFILSPFFTFTMVLWIIVMVIVNLIGIFAISEV